MPTSTVAPSPARAALRQVVRLLAILERTELSRWRHHGLTLTQVRALHRISSTGSATCSEVADHLHIQASATTGLLERLVQRGMVERGTRAGDRRVVEMRLTPAGVEAVAAITELRSGGLGRALERMKIGDLEHLARSLDHLTELLEQGERDPFTPRDGSGE